MRNHFFIFFVSNSQIKCYKYRQMAKFFMNRMVIDEDDQSELIWIYDVEALNPIDFFSTGEYIAIELVLYLYQDLTEVIVSKKVK